MADDIKIGKALEEQLEREEEEIVKSLAEEELHSDVSLKGDGKAIIIMIAVIVGIFIFFIGGFKLYDKFTAASVVDVDQLHKDNLNGKLDEEEGYTYNQFSFVKADGLWWTEIYRSDTLVKIPLHFSPNEVESIPVEGKLNPEFNKGVDIYISIDPDVMNKYYTLAISELSFNIAKGIERRPVGSCTKEDAVCDNRTIVSCNNTQGKPIVELAIDETAGIEYIDTCIKIKGNGYEIVKAADKILYKWYGIMD
ncbi:MAG: hypothetical protein ABH824_03160 [Nanoarchaeota archaeon]